MTTATNPPSGFQLSALQTFATPLEFRIRAAKSADAPLLHEFIRELAYYEGLAHECHITVEAAFEYILGPRRVADAIIAEVEGKPAGFAVYYWTLSTFAARPGLYLEDLFVRPTFRKRGIGSALLHEVGRIAHRAGCGRFEWIALKWNEKARALYRSSGAREMDKWTLFRMDSEALAKFAGAGAGKPHDGGPLMENGE
jgi:GNAT superfamily N-acetyltransferase